MRPILVLSNNIYRKLNTMDKTKRKELVSEWKNRRPEMGVISFKCKATGDNFIDISKDMKADYNSNRFKLLMGNHPKKKCRRFGNNTVKTGLNISL